jgi:hypothetical protein
VRPLSSVPDREGGITGAGVIDGNLTADVRVRRSKSSQDCREGGDTGTCTDGRSVPTAGMLRCASQLE